MTVKFLMFFNFITLMLNILVSAKLIWLNDYRPLVSVSVYDLRVHWVLSFA